MYFGDHLQVDYVTVRFTVGHLRRLNVLIVGMCVLGEMITATAIVVDRIDVNVNQVDVGIRVAKRWDSMVMIAAAAAARQCWIMPPFNYCSRAVVANTTTTAAVRSRYTVLVYARQNRVVRTWFNDVCYLKKRTKI